MTMEILGALIIPGWLITILFVIIALYLYSKWKLSLWKNLGIPGPEPTLFLGNMGSYFDKGTCWTELELMKKYGDVVGLYKCHQPTLLLSDPEMIKEIFIKNFHIFTNRFLPYNPSKRVESVLVFAEDIHWKFLRCTLSPTFTSGKMKLMMPKIRKCCISLVENIEQQRDRDRVVDLKEICEAYTMDVISSTAFGIEVNSQKEPNNQFVKYGKKAAIGALPKLVPLLILLFPFMKKILKIDLTNKEVANFFDAVVDSTIDIRRQSKKTYDDFLQLMLTARHTDSNEDNSTPGDLREYKNRGLNKLELQANSQTFFTVGYDTTSQSLSFACYCLAIYPDVEEKLVEEIDTVLCGEEPQYDSIKKLQYLDRFLSEVLRLYGAAISIFRECKKDVKINNVFIPQGAEVNIDTFVLHRNPKYWPNPEKFDPDRFTEENKGKRPEYSYVPFGLGPRMCLGMKLALLEAKMALVYMIQNFTFSTSDKTEIPITFDKGFILRATNGIFLNISKRSKTLPNLK